MKTGSYNYSVPFISKQVSLKATLLCRTRELNLDNANEQDLEKTIEELGTCDMPCLFTWTPYYTSFTRSDFGHEGFRTEGESIKTLYDTNQLQGFKNPEGVEKLQNEINKFESNRW